MNIFIDFETRYSTANNYCLQSRNRPKGLSIVQYVRDPRFKVFGVGISVNDDSPIWFSRNESEQALHDLPWAEIKLIGHNIKFDAFILKEVYGIVPKSYIDTKGMSKAVLGKTIKGHSLNELALHYGLQPKGTMKIDGLESLTAEQERELSEYCLHDVTLCREIYNRLKKEFPKSQYEILHRTGDMFVNPKLVLNVPLLEEAAKNEIARRAKIFEEIDIEKSTFASNKKFAALLEARGFTTPHKPSPRQKDATGQPLQIPALALGDTGFLELLESENEELKRLCEARVAAKSTLLETRTTKLAALGRTGPWPFDVEFSGADQTHRFSGGSGAGGNPQNFTRDSALRAAVCAPAGCALVVGDFAQVEFRLSSYLASEKGLINLIERQYPKGQDAYTTYASEYFERVITKDDDSERRFGKESLLALSYGMWANKFKDRVKLKVGMNLSYEEAIEGILFYRERYPRIPKIWEVLEQYIPLMTRKDLHMNPPELPIELIYNGFILPDGLVVRYPNLRQRENLKRNQPEWVFDVYSDGHLEQRNLYGGKFLEGVCQSLAGVLCRDAMRPFGNAVQGQVHDEIILVVPEEQAEVAALALQAVMSKAPAWLPKAKFAAEVGIGKNWLEAK